MSAERELEQLSALVDGALDEGAERALLARLGERPALWARWGRYHLIGDVLRGEPVTGAALGVATAVREQLTGEPVVVAPARARVRRSRGWLRPAVGLAAAASFGAAVVAVLPRHEAPTGQPVVAAAAPPQAPMARPDEHPVEWRVVQQVPITRWQPPRPGPDGDLHRFLTDHSEFAATGVKGAMPLATLVGYGAGR